MAASGSTAETALVTLRLDLGTETISGTFEDEGGAERPFWGWLELSAALDRRRGHETGACDRIRPRPPFRRNSPPSGAPDRQGDIGKGV